MATMEDCSIVKSLEKKFSMTDYVQWERTDRLREGHSKQTPSLPPIKWLPEALGNHWKIVKKGKGKTTQQQIKWEARLCAEKFCSKKCNYTWHTREKISADNACYMELKEKIKILKYLITAKKKQVDEYKEYNGNLLDINMKLIEKLKELEENAMAESRTVLIQYNKFRKGISGVGEWKQQEIEAAKDDLKDTEKTVKQKSEGHELISHPADMGSLYIQRSDGRGEEAVPKHDELVDVEEITLAHKRRMENTLKEKEQEVFHKIAKKQINFLPSGFQEVMLHNALMKKEIEIHIELNKNMEKNNLDLQRNLLHLLKSRKDGREEIFTDVFQNQPKCTPDTEIVLDIPREECLPI
ncbi:uncharacterized protein C20orf96 homolog isoform X2 [Mobula birostris]|uniref:uncharacterized protein C20orf96 homolog isoform X2 n=1 Tax=Mobula birostris TaxID=1983395 RepID=UPI003B27D9F6